MNRSKINLPKQNRSRGKKMKERADFQIKARRWGKAKQNSQTAATKRCRGQLQTLVPSQKHEKNKEKLSCESENQQKLMNLFRVRHMHTKDTRRSWALTSTSSLAQAEIWAAWLSAEWTLNTKEMCKDWRSRFLFVLLFIFSSWHSKEVPDKTLLEPVLPAVKVQSPYHWTSKEVPIL